MTDEVIFGRLCCCTDPHPVGSWPYTCFNKGCLGVVPIEKRVDE